MRRYLARLAWRLALRLDPPAGGRAGHVYAAEGAVVARQGAAVVVVQLNPTSAARLQRELAGEVMAMLRGRSYTPGGRHGGTR